MLHPPQQKLKESFWYPSLKNLPKPGQFIKLWNAILSKLLKTCGKVAPNSICMGNGRAPNWVGSKIFGPLIIFDICPRSQQAVPSHTLPCLMMDNDPAFHQSPVGNYANCCRTPALFRAYAGRQAGKGGRQAGKNGVSKNTPHKWCPSVSAHVCPICSKSLHTKFVQTGRKCDLCHEFSTIRSWKLDLKLDALLCNRSHWEPLSIKVFITGKKH